MKDRGLCKFYIAHRECSKGREAEVFGICQKCQLFSPAYRSLRPNVRKQKLEKARKRDEADY